MDIPVYDLLNQNLTMMTGIKKDPKVKVYPNPVDTQLTLQSDQNNVRYILTDASGQKIMTSVLSSFKQSIDVSNIRNGFYFLSIESDTGVELHKLNINHN
jgi:hypothetical protein